MPSCLPAAQAITLVTVYDNCRLRIELFSITGQAAGIIFNDTVASGSDTFHYEAGGIPGGLLICRVRTGIRAETRVMAHIIQPRQLHICSSHTNSTHTRIEP